MEQIKIIDKAIKKVVEENKDLIDLDLELNEKLRNTYEYTTDIDHKKIKLLNYLLKYPKKKILFKMTLKDKYEREKSISVGVNTSGLGLTIYSYESNLRNIGEYHTKEQFLHMIKNKEFIKEFLKNIPKKDKKNLPIIKQILAITNNSEKEDKEIRVEGDIKITIGENSVGYMYNKLDCEERLRVFNIEFNSVDDFQKEISDFNIDLNLRLFKDMVYLFKYKDKIKPILKRELEIINQEEQNVKNKLKILDDNLASFEALERL